MIESFMATAVEMAVENVRSRLGGPFAALVVRDGRIVGRGTNLVTTSNDPTAHAEINAIRAACAELGTFELTGCDIYATCEPCPMCLGAVYWSRARRVIYAATRKDARRAGFDDDRIYRELVKAPQDRRIEMIRSSSADGRRPFEAWMALEDRIDY